MELPDTEKSFVVELAPEGLAPSEPHVVVVLAAESAELSYIDDPRNYSFRDQLLNWQHLLHFGVGLGLLWTVLVFLSNLLPLLLAITGLTVWWKKRKVPKREGARVEESALSSSELTGLFVRRVGGAPPPQTDTKGER